MSPALLLPMALGALAAVLVPLAIHIARSTETHTIDFAALRWLDPSPKPVRRLRLDERLLLAARILLVVAVALFLARPVVWNLSERQPIIAVSPDVDARTIDNEKGRRVWLAPGFPGIDQAAPSAPGATASLIRQLDAETPASTSITFVVPALLSGVDAERPRLSRRVEWRVAPFPPSSKPVQRREPPALTVRYSADAEEGAHYFRAAAIAGATPGQPSELDATPADRPLPKDARYLVWLSPAPMPAVVLDWIADGGVALLSYDTPSPVDGAKRVTWRDDIGEPLATAGRFGDGRVLQLTRPLTPAAMPQLVEADFPDTLWRLLVPPPPPTVVAAVDHAPTLGASVYQRPPVDLRPWLALVIALVFAAERWLATRRLRAVAP